MKNVPIQHVPSPVGEHEFWDDGPWILARGLFYDSEPYIRAVVEDKVRQVIRKWVKANSLVR